MQPGNVIPNSAMNSFTANSAATKDRSQRAAIQFFVIRDFNLGKRLVAAKHHVAPLLPPQSKARLPQRPRALTAVNTIWPCKAAAARRPQKTGTG